MRRVLAWKDGKAALAASAGKHSEYTSTPTLESSAVRTEAQTSYLQQCHQLKLLAYLRPALSLTDVTHVTSPHVKPKVRPGVLVGMSKSNGPAIIVHCISGYAEFFDLCSQNMHNIEEIN